MIAPDRPPAGFYVYLLVDPRDEKPFYAGKGQNWRAWQHERDVRAGKGGANPAKVHRIQEIVAAGLSVEVAIAATFDFESDALNYEFRIVDASPSLLNVMPGGGGASLSEEEAARRLKARRLRLDRLRMREARDRARADLDAQTTKFGSGDQKRESEVRTWLDGANGAEAKRVISRKVASAEKQIVARQLVGQFASLREDRTRRVKRSKQFGQRRVRAEINPADYAIPCVD